jgi:hypothetical protein
MVTKLGVLKFDGKSYTMNAAGEEKFKVKFVDADENKVTLEVARNEFEGYGPGDEIEPSLLVNFKQKKLDEEPEPEEKPKEKDEE